ncbi:ion transporter [Amycolatopsis antarctica]|uniref:Ion transporter n=1 Tax=Amycolatopsis antarctica TaxID=1854586 RepID=A0A263CWN9_9PSEU|nr:ion channel [Amycolatopsis antarctica]OZM70553.1 ion transporter [Amycolatopsis antarctica]
MPVFLGRLLARFAILRSWAAPFAVVLFVFATSWPVMALVEPAGSEVVSPANYWWWFVVTASTVGYGDFFPESLGGHLVGVYVIIGGIATLTALFTQLASRIEKAKGRRMQGSAPVSLSGHIAVLGYLPGRSEQIVGELLADAGRAVVLCAWDETSVHPMADQDVDFVRGDLTDSVVLRRAGVERAHSVLIDARDDNEALAIAVTVDHVHAGVHLVVALRDMARAPHLRYVNASVHCVQWHTPRMITEELQDPGISQVYEELVTAGGNSTFSTEIPESMAGVTFGDCQTALGRRYGATVLAARTGAKLLVSPGWGTELAAGTRLYYVGHERIAPSALAAAIHAPHP